MSHPNLMNANSGKNSGNLMNANSALGAIGAPSVSLPPLPAGAAAHGAGRGAEGVAA